jgi:hypothetical protein
LLLLIAALLPPAASSATVVPTTRSSTSQVDPVPINTVSAAAFGMGLRADGRVIRVDGDLTVERIPLPPALRGGRPVYRVTLVGRYPARADRYVVLADGSPVGFGIPAPGERALRTITTDRAVTTASVTARYGDPRPAVSSPAPSAGLPPAAPGTVENPAARGPHEVERAEYDLGDEVYQPSGLGARVELAGDVHYPTDLDAGPYPLVLFMHGNHSTCYRGTRSSYEWPCRPRWHPLPNYAGYDYIAERLASWGYIVVSVSANGVNYFGNWVDDTGMRQRGEVLEKHIDLWDEWSRSPDGPFGSTFVGHVDLSRIGTMGHSRGGEGVVWNTIVDRERETPYGIDAVLALAPVDFTRVPINDVPFDVMLPYCDGDVSDLEGIHFFDDSRYLVPDDPTPKSTVTVFGANHNFFNRVWSPSGGYPGSFDDGGGSGCRDRLTESQQRHVGAAYIVGFFRRYVGQELDLDPMWTGAETPTLRAKTLVSYLAPPQDRLDLDRFTQATDLSAGTNGAVVPVSMSTFGWCSDEYLTPCLTGGLQWIDVHLSFSYFLAEQLPGLGQGVLGWTRPEAAVHFEIPADRADVAGFDAIQLRAALNPSYEVNGGITFQDFSLVLIDGSGARSDIAASEVGNDPLAHPSSGRRGGGHYILNQIRFPLDAFGGVDLSDIRGVELLFDRTPAGVIDVADLAFTRGAS